MVLDHVAQRAGVVVVAAAVFDADGLRRRDLHAVDVTAVPDRLEDHVREAQRHDVLHRLFAEVVVDAVDLALVEDLRDLGLQRARRVEVGTERLLDDDPRPALWVVVRPEAGSVELFDDLGEDRRRRREVEEPVAARSRVARRSRRAAARARLNDAGSSKSPVTYDRCLAKSLQSGSFAGPERENSSIASLHLVSERVVGLVRLREKPTMPKFAGKTSPSRRLYIAGISMRFARSPLAPKKTMLHGSVIRFVSSPARSGFCFALPSDCGRTRVVVSLMRRSRGGRDRVGDRRREFGQRTVERRGEVQPEPRRPRRSSASKSPSACARSSVRKPKPMPGIARSIGGSAVNSRKTPVAGPPLCSCPVECRKRGPKPTVVATVQPVADVEPQIAQCADVLGIHVEVGVEREIVARFHLTEQRGERRLQSRRRARDRASRRTG